MRDRWQWFDLADGGGVLELDERATPRGVAIELAVDVGPDGRTWAFWLASESGALLAVVRGADA